MAKHLPPRGSALPPWRASLLPALMWLILLTVFPNSLLAQNFEYTYQGKTVKYFGDPETKTCYVSGEQNVSGDLILPAHPVYDSTEYTLTEINGEFDKCSNLTSLTIPNTVTSLGGYFVGCANLKSVVVPNSVTSITGTFRDCTGLTSINIPNSVTTIGTQIFENCTSLTSVTIPSSVTNFGTAVFLHCTGLTSAVIEAGISELGYGTFMYCNNLEKVTLPNTLTSIGRSAFSQCKKLTSVNIPASVTEIGEDAFRNCESLSSISLPNVTSIPSLAFQECTNLKSIILGNALTSIDQEAFYRCENLESITLPNSLTTIGECAFQHCSSLKDLTIPESITSIGDQAFHNCSSLTSISFPDTPIEIGSAAFMGCSSLTQLVIPDSWTSIGANMFADCTSLLTIEIPQSIATIENEAFRNCHNLPAVIIPQSVNTLSSNAFSDCTSLKKIAVPVAFSAETYSNATTIGYESDCEVTSDGWIYGAGRKSILFAPVSLAGEYSIPESVTSIGQAAFADCKNLTAITIPASITEIGDKAFTSCSLLTSITYDTVEPITASDNIFDSSTYQSATLNMPQTTEDQVKSHQPWNNFTTIVAKVPSADDIKVNYPEFEVPTYGYVWLNDLIKNGVVEGVPGENTDYTITSSETSGVYVNNNYGYFYFSSPSTATISFTNKEYPGISFSFDVTAKYGPAKYVDESLGTIYIGETKTLIIPDDYLPVSYFTVTSEPYSGTDDPDGEFELKVNGNELTITGISVGVARLEFKNKFCGSVANITIAEKPSADDIKVNEESIVVPAGMAIYLSTLIRSGVVEGVSGDDTDYSITSSVTSGVTIYDNYGWIRFNSPCISTVTYTNKEFPEISFSIEMKVENSPASYISQNIGTVYIGGTKTLTIPDGYMPLSDFSLSKKKNPAYPDADFDFEVNGNELTLTGISEGEEYLYIDHRFGTVIVRVPIAEKPEADNIRVNVSEITYPLGAFFYLSYLIDNKIVEGLTGSNADYTVTAADPDMIGQSGSAIYFASPGTTTLTYTNKDLPEIKFSIKVNAMYNPGTYISNYFSNARPVYVGESKSIVLPDDYIPFSNFDIVKSIATEGANFEYTIEGNTLTVTGIGEGRGQLILTDKVLRTVRFGGTIYIKTREVAVEVSDEGEAIAGSQVGVPVTVTLPPDIDVTPTEGTQIVWETEDDGIVKVNAETGEITPLKPGKTTITVKRVSATPNPALMSRAGAQEETLVTIEFWVTELELAEEMTLTAGSSEQLIYTIYAGEDQYPEKRVNPVWSSSNTAVATVDSDGNVTALSEGTAVITLTTGIGTRQTIVTVEPDDTPAGKLTINPSHVSLTVGGRIGLSTEGSGGKTVKWTTSNSFAATVSETGVVTAVGVGSAVITATVEGTSLKASANVTVFERTTGIEAADTAEPMITVEDLTVIISGVAADIPVEIYNVSGRLIAARKGSCSVAVGQSGIYIVCIGGSARKVAVNR